ncbi:MAG: hypothetical protein ACJ73V_04705 [Acidimicrobiia bacterium]
MAIPVLLILAVLWAAVLVPPVLRSRTESRRGGVGELHSRLGALNRQRSSARSMGVRGGRAPLRSVPRLEAARSRATGRATRGPHPVPGADEAARRAAPMTAAQKRRRDVVMILVGVVIVSLVLAVLVNPMLWIAHGVADVLLAVYLYLLVLRRRGSLASHGDDEFWGSGPTSPARPVAVAHPRVPARPELAPLPGAAKPRRSAAG